MTCGSPPVIVTVAPGQLRVSTLGSRSARCHRRGVRRCRRRRRGARRRLVRLGRSLTVTERCRGEHGISRVRGWRCDATAPGNSRVAGTQTARGLGNRQLTQSSSTGSPSAWKCGPKAMKSRPSAPASKARGSSGAIRIASSSPTVRTSSPSFTNPLPRKIT